MAIVFKCITCGGSLEILDGHTMCICEYCNTQQSIPSLDNEKKINLLMRADKLFRDSEFDMAAGRYESIVSEFAEESVAYWRLCLCKYGVEYVDDPATGNKVPTCHRTSFQSIFDDENYKLALQYADISQKTIYEADAKAIDDIQKGILEIAHKEEPYDIFICYKETAEDGQRTKDSVMAQDIYDAITNMGYKVFFSRITLEDKLGQEYEPFIFSALNSAKIMLVIGTDIKHFDAVWVKNEWSRFLDMMKNDKRKKLIPCYADIDANNMPKEIKNLQGQDMTKVGFIQDLVRGIGKIISPENGRGEFNKQAAQKAALEELAERGNDFLELGNYKKAKEVFEKATMKDPKSYKGWWGLILASTENLTKHIEVNDLSEIYDTYQFKELEEWYGYAKKTTPAEELGEMDAKLIKYFNLLGKHNGIRHKSLYEKRIDKGNKLLERLNSRKEFKIREHTDRIKTLKDKYDIEIKECEYYKHEAKVANIKIWLKRITLLLPFLCLGLTYLLSRFPEMLRTSFTLPGILIFTGFGAFVAWLIFIPVFGRSKKLRIKISEYNNSFAEHKRNANNFEELCSDEIESRDKKEESLTNEIKALESAIENMTAAKDIPEEVIVDICTAVYAEKFDIKYDVNSDDGAAYSDLFEKAAEGYMFLENIMVA